MLLLQTIGNNYSCNICNKIHEIPDKKISACVHKDKIVFKCYRNTQKTNVIIDY